MNHLVIEVVRTSLGTLVEVVGCSAGPWLEQGKTTATWQQLGETREQEERTGKYFPDYSTGLGYAQIVVAHRDA